VRKTLRGFLALSPLTLATAATALVQTKILAVFLGPDGTGFYGLALALLTLLSTIGGIGVSSALMKQIAEIGGTPRERDIWRTALFGIGTVVAVGGALTAVILLNSEFVVRLFLSGASISESDKHFIVDAAAAAVVPAALVPTIGGFLRGLRSLREYVVAGVIGAIAPMVAVVLGALWFDARGAFVGFVIGEVLVVTVLMFFAVRVARRQRIPFEVETPRRQFAAIEKALLMLGVFALATGLASSVGAAVGRAHIANAFDLRTVGFFAAAWAITNRVPSLIYQTFTSYLLPELSALRRDWTAIVKVQNDACRISLLAVTPLLAVGIAAGPWIVSILLSDRFLPMVDLLRFMLIGELLSVVAWAGSSAFFPSGRPVSSAAFEWCFWVSFVIGIFVAGSLHELNAIGGAYIASYVLVLVLIYGWEWRHHGFRWTRKNERLIALSLIAVSASAAISMLTELATAIVILLVLVILSVWALATIERSEWDALRRAIGRVDRTAE
jgi:O-antigen/teichoic acid export membrane protein